jgi:TonB family protein
MNCQLRTIALAAMAFLLASCAQTAISRSAPVRKPPQLAPELAQAMRNAPSSVDYRALCDNYAQVMSSVVYPREALIQSIPEGQVLIEFTVRTSGAVVNVHALASTNPIFAQSAVNTVSQYRCRAMDREVRVVVPFMYILQK